MMIKILRFWLLSLMTKWQAFRERHSRGLHKKLLRNSSDALYFGKYNIREMVKQLAKDPSGKEKEIEPLLTLERQAAVKPIFPRHRPINSFNAGEEIIHYDCLKDEFVPVDLSLMVYHNGGLYGFSHYVFHPTSLSLESRRRENGINVWLQSPSIMYLWEFEYFLGNLEYFDLWIKNTPDCLNEKLLFDRLFLALIREKNKRSAIKGGEKKRTIDELEKNWKLFLKDRSAWYNVEKNLSFL